MKRKKEPDLFEVSKRVKRKKAWRQWWKDHTFDVLNLFVALLALVVAIAGLYLPKG